MNDHARVEPRPGEFVEPRLTDLGSLVELTRSSDLFFGHALSGSNDLGFSASVTPTGHSGSTVMTAEGTIGGANVGPTGEPLSAASPSGAGSAGGALGAAGAGGQLPFTGYSITIVAALGSALSAAGVAIRRKLTRSERW
jgi:hypothetical protein